MSKIKKINELVAIVKNLKKHNKKIVFTNGVFDLIHIGHVRYLRKAKELGDVLIVAINSDSSVKKIKGNNRPIIPAAKRAEVLSSFEFIDYVTIFNEPNPINVIKKLLPDVLVKGGDWKINEVLGKDIVEANGGKVVTIPPVKNRSTTNLINLIKKRYQKL
jgi:rfaE bifunctional protein nucleotidyltransferase chain/domain